MPTETTNYGFTKDNEDEFYNVNTVNANLDKIDTEMKRIEDESKSFNEQVADNTNAIVNANTKLDTHIKDDLGHVRYLGNQSGANAMIVTASAGQIPFIDTTVTNPVPKIGVAFRFVKSSNNTSNVTLSIQDTLLGKSTLSYPVYDSQAKNLTANALVAGVAYTVCFTGSAFFLQGSGSGVKDVVRGSQTFATPGTHAFTVPDGVSKLTAYIFGAGGGGGGCINEYYGGGGGGAGAFMLASINVTPGQVLSLAVGAGGGGPAGANHGAPGGSSGITILGLQYVAGGGGGGTYGGASGSPWGQGGQGGGWSRTGITGYVTNGATPPPGSLYQFSAAAPSNFLLSYSGGSGDAGKTPNYGGGGGGGPSDAQGGFAANSNTPGAEPTVFCNFKGGKGGNGAYKGSGDNGGLAAGGGGSSHTVGKAGDGGNGKIILYW